jgi:hypothetical protein
MERHIGISASFLGMDYSRLDLSQGANDYFLERPVAAQALKAGIR